MSNLISIKINNWKKYHSHHGKQPVRPWWFKMSNRLHLDQDFINFSHEEFRAFICILCESSLQNKDTLILDLDYHPKIWKLSRRSMSDTIQKLVRTSIVTYDLVTLGDQQRRREEKRREEIYTSTDVDLPSFDLIKTWNENRGTLAEVKSITTKRSKLVSKAVKEIPSPEDWTKIIKYLSTDPFYSGKNDRGWTANFDFLIRPGKAVELLERATNKKQTELVIK